MVKSLGNSSALKAMKDLEKSSLLTAVKLLENSPALKAMKAFENSSAMRAMKDLEKYSLLTTEQLRENSPALKAIKAFEDSYAMRVVKDIEKSSLLTVAQLLENSPALKAMKAFEDSFAMRVVKDLEKSSLLTVAQLLDNSPALKAMKSFENSSAMNAIRDLQDTSRFASFNELAKRFSSQMVGPLTLSEAFQVVAENYMQTPGSTEIDRFEALSSQVELLVQKAPKGALSKEFYLSTILALFLFWISQISSMQSEEKILLRLEKFEETISQQLIELKANEDIDTFYIVMRAVNLRVKPNTKSQIITTLHPNVKVKLMERASKWIRIEYFDHTKNIYVSGWASKKYLKMAGRSLITKVAREHTLPFDVRIPNAETLTAIRELEAGRGKRFKNVKDFMADLNADD